jgi:hypothetical protein
MLRRIAAPCAAIRLEAWPTPGPPTPRRGRPRASRRAHSVAVVLHRRGRRAPQHEGGRTVSPWAPLLPGHADVLWKSAPLDASAGPSLRNRTGTEGRSRDAPPQRAKRSPQLTKPRPRFGRKPRNQILERRNTRETDARYSPPNTTAILSSPRVSPGEPFWRTPLPRAGFSLFGPIAGCRVPAEAGVFAGESRDPGAQAWA